jgi:hypothetical protein
VPSYREHTKRGGILPVYHHIPVEKFTMIAVTVPSASKTNINTASFMLLLTFTD